MVEDVVAREWEKGIVLHRSKRNVPAKLAGQLQYAVLGGFREEMVVR